MKEKTLGHIYALFTILVWGSCFVLTKVMLTAYTPTQIIPLRMGLAYLTLWALRPKTMKLPWKDELMFILIGITGGSFYFFLQNTAAAHTSAANVSILVSMSPILTVILAQLFSRKGEKLGKLVYIGAVVAIAGVVLVVLNGTLSFHLSPLGDLLALAAALMWAVYSILVKKYTERYDNFLVTRRVFLWAFLTSLPLVLLTDGLPSLTPLFTQPNILISWLFLGVFGNAVCFAIWNIAFKRLGVVVTNNYLYASPFVTVVVGWLLLDEKISWMSILGAVLITLGVILPTRARSNNAMEIRKSTTDDVPAILEIFRAAKAYMAAHGNPTQWGGDYPGLPELLPDIARGDSYVLTENGTVVGTFSFIIGDEPTYQVLLNGRWHADRPYGTIHRLASSGTVRGVSRACFDFCTGLSDYVRVDTHADNRAMQAAIEGYGFRKCGNIYASSGTLRTAYDYVREG